MGTAAIAQIFRLAASRHSGTAEGQKNAQNPLGLHTQTEGQTFQGTSGEVVVEKQGFAGNGELDRAPMHQHVDGIDLRRLN